MVKLEEQWAEISTLILIAVGFIVAVLLQNPALSYITIFLAGFLAGRIYYIKHKRVPILPFVLMIVGFLFGYVIASFWVNRFLVLILFAIAAGVSYYLHLKQILVIFKSERFIK